MTEKEYRKIERESYSSLSLFSVDRKSYYRKYILKEKKKREEADHFVYGSLVDCLLFTPEEFDERFVVGTFNEPRPLMKKFVDNLVKHVIANPTKESFRSCLQWAYNDTKYDSTGNVVAFKTQSFEKVATEFQDDCGGYYDYLIDTIADQKMLISTEDYDKAKIAVNTLRTNTSTGPILLQETTNSISVFKQLVILYELKGVEFKSMLDLVIVDHDKRIVKFYDLKTTHNAEQFPFSYLKFNYYIQNGIYTKAVKEWMGQLGIENYSLQPMQFIVIDSYNYMEPLVYETDEDICVQSTFGFRKGGRHYKGVLQLVDELQWHKVSDIWTISYDNYQNHGIVKLKIEEDEERGEGVGTF